MSGSSVAGLTVLAGCSSSGSTGNASGGNGSAGGNESGGQTAIAGAETAASTGSNTSATGTNGSENATAGGSNGPNGTNGTSGTSGSGGAGSGSKTVGMHTEGGNYYFDPIGLFVEKGTTITFEVESGSHSSTAYKKGNPSAEVTRIPDGAKAWNSDTLPEGKSYDHTFETEGTYDYFCLPHKALGMVGRIVVGSPGGPAEGSMPPDGEVPKSGEIVDQKSIAYSDFS